MATTLHAQDVRKQRTHFGQPTTNFRNKVLCLRALLTMHKLGLHTRRWASRMISWLQTDPQWISEDLVEQAERNKMLDELLEKNELAIRKFETRVANRNAKKNPKPSAVSTPP